MTRSVSDTDRHANVRQIPWWDVEKLRASTVMVVGAGALGNEVLKNLAMVGVGRIVVIDHDRVEASNLTRSILFRRRDCGRAKAEVAAESLRDIDPGLRVEPLVADVMTEVGWGWFRDCDLVIGCLDNREARLWVNRVCWQATRPWIDGAIQELNGVVKFFHPPQSACYECGMTDMDYRLLSLRQGCGSIPAADPGLRSIPTTPTIASIIGGLQAQEALKLLHGHAIDAGSAMVFNGDANRFYRTNYALRPDCPSHETITAEPLPHDHTATARELFSYCRSLLAAASPAHSRADSLADSTRLTLALERPWLESVHCDRCVWSEPVMRTVSIVRPAPSRCPHCGDPVRPSLHATISSDSPLANQPLSELGFPDYDLIRMRTACTEWFGVLRPTRSPRQPGSMIPADGMSSKSDRHE